MTFSRARPAGWTNDITTISAVEINQIDVNQSRAIDGNGGGPYTPSAELRSPVRCSTRMATPFAVDGSTSNPKRPIVGPGG